MANETLKIAIIGGGHAGVEAASWIASDTCEVSIFSNEKDLPYFRPRLVGVAFGQEEPDAISIKKPIFYETRGIDLRLDTPAMVDFDTKTVNGESFDGIIMATGASARQLSLPTAKPLTLWSLDDARTIRAQVQPGKTIHIIGGGVLGLESAIRAQLAGLSVHLYEICPHLVSGLLGDAGEAALIYALEARGISLHLGQALPEFAEDDFILCSIGAAPKIPFKTDPTLKIAPGCFAAGDVALPTGERPTSSVRKAIQQAHLAADNLLADLKGEPLESWTNPIFPLFMKVDTVEFHLYGKFCYPDLLETRLDDGQDPLIYQACLSYHNRPLAVRMVGTRAKFNDWSTEIFKVITAHQL